MKKVISILSAAAVIVSCIHNDLPYPVIEATITSLEVDGASSVEINRNKRVIQIVLEETTDIRNVTVKNISFNDPKVKPSWNVCGVRDLTKPLKVTLSTFDDYDWRIEASQPIERWFTMPSQVGESAVDFENKRVVVKVAASADVSNLPITSCKLGPKEISTYTPDPSTIKDFTDEQTIMVAYHSVREEWTIYVEKSSTTVRFLKLDPWTKIVWLTAEGISGNENGFKIREAGTEEWKVISPTSANGGKFSASVDGLKPETEYECKAFSGSDETETETFTTESERQLPNSGFETWSNAESVKYYSFYDPESLLTELQTKWWCSGNKGSTTVGSSHTITMPCTDDYVEGKSSLLMASDYVIIKFAAGNIFSGEYYNTIGTSGGVIRFGRPFTNRPQKLTAWIKFRAGIITEKTFGGAPDNDPVKVGDRDRGCIWVALGDWDYHKYGGSEASPVEVNTTDKSTFFDPKGENVIAYGTFVAERDYDQWTKIEIPLEYVTTSKRPTHIIVSCASSKLGDYFTGSSDSKMWIDDIRLEY
ncbi:MAG: PCMD domain-containing protein [Candidatus Cryptobacteroides sp.]